MNFLQLFKEVSDTLCLNSSFYKYPLSAGRFEHEIDEDM